MLGSRILDDDPLVETPGHIARAKVHLAHIDAMITSAGTGGGTVGSMGGGGGSIGGGFTGGVAGGQTKKEHLQDAGG